MKVVIVSDKGIVTNIYHDVYEPVVDKRNNVIEHSNGKIYGFKEKDRDFLIIEEHVPVQTGDNIYDTNLKDFDESDEFEKDLGEQIKEGLEEIKEDVKEFFEGDEDENK